MLDGPPPFRVPAPAAEALVAWPPAFGTRFILFVDVEEEFDWRAPLDRAARSTTAMAAFPAAHRRFAAAGVPLACMVDYPIATDPRAVEILAGVIADGRSEIGTQLHPWVNPPFGAEDAGRGFPGRLPPELEVAKLDALTRAIGHSFGRAPRAYRAGRYGIGPHSRALLAARGYRLDSSVRARFDYSEEGGPDFHAVGNDPYWSDGLVELPLTTVFTGWAGRRGPGLHRFLSRVPKGAGLGAKLRLVSRVPLTPESVPVGEALSAIDRALADGSRLLVFSFHSPSLEPGHTPYVRDSSDLRRFWAWWDAVLARLEQRGVRAASVEEVLAASSGSEPVAALLPP